MARCVTSIDGFNGTYAHELSDMLIGNLTYSELTFGNPASRDPDAGNVVELEMFGGQIPLTNETKYSSTAKDLDCAFCSGS